MENSITWGVVVAVLGVAFVLWVVRDKIRGKPVPDALRTGKRLPEFEAMDEDGNGVASRDLSGSPAVILFVRGTWCPFCSKQVANLTRYYKDINDLGAKLILVTPKPLETTRRVAEMFGVDFDFWLDESLEVSKKLGLLQPAGVPKDQRGQYGEDTLWPTSLVVDASGTIRFSELSRFIADRPDPRKLLNALQKL